jgi:PAS domain S-box-containing protein
MHTVKITKPLDEFLMTPAYALAIILATIFLIEISVMLVLAKFPGLSEWQSTLIDGTVLTVVLFPCVYYLLFLPLRRRIVEQLRHQEHLNDVMDDLRHTKVALQDLNSILEQRILERTQELLEANQHLRTSLDAQKHAETGLSLAAKVFEHASEAIVITDSNGSIVDVNQAYIKIAGFQREEVLGANPRIGKSGRHDHEFYKRMWAAITTKKQWSGEIWDRRKNGDLYPKWLTINAVCDNEGRMSNFIGWLFTIH